MRGAISLSCSCRRRGVIEVCVDVMEEEIGRERTSRKWQYAIRMGGVVIGVFIP